MGTNFEVTGIEGCPRWLQKLFIFAVEYRVKNMRVSKVGDDVWVTIKVDSKEHEERIREEFPFQVKFRKTVRLSLGGTVFGG